MSVSTGLPEWSEGAVVRVKSTRDNLFVVTNWHLLSAV